MKRLQELIAGYSSENIWNMDKSDCSFKALPDKGLAEKYKKAKSGKNQSNDSRLLSSVKWTGQGQLYTISS